jgi:hypothetical protein
MLCAIGIAIDAMPACTTKLGWARGAWFTSMPMGGPQMCVTLEVEQLITCALVCETSTAARRSQTLETFGTRAGRYGTFQTGTAQAFSPLHP